MKRVDAGGEEGVCLATFGPDLMRRCRAHEVLGRVFRRPDLYGPLIAREVRESLIRRGT